MSDIICVTDRKNCRGDFIKRVEEIAEAGPAAIILREKDLSETEYGRLAETVMEICEESGVTCVLHSFTDVALRLSAKGLHMPMEGLRMMSAEERAAFDILGASCHSVEEAVEAQNLGCGYVTAGHVFATDCKKGLEPRGTGFLEEVCDAVDIPVYAIGGINAGNIADVIGAGAAGACVMSGLMTCDDPREHMKAMIGAAKA